MVNIIFVGFAIQDQIFETKFHTLIHSKRIIFFVFLFLCWKHYPILAQKQYFHLIINPCPKTCRMSGMGIEGMLKMVRVSYKDMQYKRIILYSSIKMKKEAFVSNHRKCLQNMVTSEEHHFIFILIFFHIKISSFYVKSACIKNSLLILFFAILNTLKPDAK